MDLYAENILDHHRHPHRRGEMQTATVQHGENNPSCGDEVMMYLKIENGHITDTVWTGQGCAISQAAMSMLSDELIGKTTEEASSFSSKQILDLLGVHIGPRRLKCALLGLHALKNALHQAKNQPMQDWNQTMES